MNISARKYFSKMVKYSKCTYVCHVSYETDPNYVSFSLGEKCGKNLGAIGLKTLWMIMPRCALNFSINEKPT